MDKVLILDLDFSVVSYRLFRAGYMHILRPYTDLTLAVRFATITLVKLDHTYTTLNKVVWTQT